MRVYKLPGGEREAAGSAGVPHVGDVGCPLHGCPLRGGDAGSPLGCQAGAGTLLIGELEGNRNKVNC